MRVLLIDFDGKIPNLALMKLSTYFKQRGHEVHLSNCEKYGVIQWDGSLLIMLIGLIAVLIGYSTKDKI